MRVHSPEAPHHGTSEQPGRHRAEKENPDTPDIIDGAFTEGIPVANVSTKQLARFVLDVALATGDPGLVTTAESLRARHDTPETRRDILTFLRLITTPPDAGDPKRHNAGGFQDPGTANTQQFPRIPHAPPAASFPNTPTYQFPAPDWRQHPRRPSPNPPYRSGR